MKTRLPRELRRLDNIARSLAETKSLKDVKALRDKAEAVRKYAQSAALNLQIQNLAAELKLRAERRAGELLSELVTHGGNRRSSHHDGVLKLSDLGINSNQSSRWRREAAVPEAVFDQYIAAANKLGQDITAQGLLRLERLLAVERKKRRRSTTDCVDGAGNGHGSQDAKVFCRNGDSPVPLICGRDATDELIREVFDELKNHRDLLKELLAPLSDGTETALATPEWRLIDRLLSDIGDLVVRLERTWFNDLDGP